MLNKKITWNKQPKKNRLSAKKLNEYRIWLTDIGYCQICGSPDIDIPHHVGIGVKRDDTQQILLCVGCHRKVHNVLFKWHITPDLEEMKFIAKET